MNEADARADDLERASRDARLLKVAVSLAALCGFALSRRLWVSTPGRLYPGVPVFDFLPRVAPAVAYAWFGALVALLVLVAVRPRQRASAAAFAALACAYVLFDESRLQPWFYQYLFMTAALAAHSWKGGDARGPLRACALVVACVYFWSGAQKLNPQFFGEVLPSLAAPYFARLPAWLARLPAPLGVLVPLTEICAGLMLLTRRWRRAGIVLALLTHAFVLLLFVPFRRNNVIWPWNVAMAAFVLILFRRGADNARDFLPRRALSLQTAALVLFGLLPALSLFGLWGQYLSSALYSGNVARAEFALSERVAGKLPPRVRSKLRPDGESFRLDINHWSYAELNVPAFPSAKVRARAAATLCELAEGPADVRLEVDEPPRFFGGETRATALDCDALEAGQYPPR